LLRFIDISLILPIAGHIAMPFSRHASFTLLAISPIRRHAFAEYYATAIISAIAADYFRFRFFIIFR
jgi:hypothetical protein